MQSFHKTLGICILLTAVVYSVIKLLGGVGFDEKAEGDAKARSRNAMVRDKGGEKSSDASTRKLRQRARKLTSAEATEFLKTTIIPIIDFENITLRDALKIVNQEIAKQTPDDQPRPKILLHPYFNRPIDDILEAGSLRIDELRLRNVPASVLLKYICDKKKITYWFYKGDFYVSPLFDDGGVSSFYFGEKLSRIKLEDVDASQLAGKLDEIIEEHDYFGPKMGINVFMTKNARTALLKGEVELPRIDLDLKIITLENVVLEIAQHTKGALFPRGRDLIFNPLNEKILNEDPFMSSNKYAVNGAAFDVILDEKILEPNPDILKKEIPPTD